MTIIKSLKLLISKFPLFLVAELISMGFGLIEAIIPIRIVKQIVEFYENKTPDTDFKELIFKVLLMFLVLSIMGLIQFLLSLYKERVARLFNVELSIKFYEKLSTIDYDFHENPMFLNDYTRSLEEGINNIYSLANNCFAVLRRIVQSIGVIITMSILDNRIIFAAIGVGLIYMLVALRIGFLNKKRVAAQRPYMRESWYINRMFTLKDSMADIKISDVDDMLIDNNNRALDNVVRVIQKYQTRTAIWGAIASTLLMLVYPLSIGLLAYSLKTPESYAGFASLTVAASTLSGLIAGLASSIGAVESVLPDCKVPFDLLNMKGLIEGIEYDDEINDFESLKMEHVNFGYTKDKLNLIDINLEINKGERVAILGANGAGKTTIVKLLLRLYDANNGNVLINGRNYRETSVSKLRKVVGAVFQNVETYALTIGENVLLRKPETKEDYELIDEALKFSGLYETVHALPDGVNTDLSREFNRRGMIFSGGQSQRLAIARGYAQDYKLLILDEPSSALDPLAEAKVYNNMLEMGKNKTIVFISHRLTSTVHADKIYLFDNGKIIESGNHEERMKKNGVYHKMFVSQSAKYLGEEYDR